MKLVSPQICIYFVLVLSVHFPRIFFAGLFLLLDILNCTGKKNLTTADSYWLSLRRCCLLNPNVIRSALREG